MDITPELEAYETLAAIFDAHLDTCETCMAAESCRTLRAIRVDLEAASALYRSTAEAA